MMIQNTSPRCEEKVSEFQADINIESKEDEIEFEHQRDQIPATNLPSVTHGDSYVGRISISKVKNMVFESWQEAEAFYMDYSQQIGFNVRKRDTRKSNDGKILMYKWVCAKEGYKYRSPALSTYKRRPRPEIRQGCGATFRVSLNRKLNKWIVKEFVEEHNHDFVKSKYAPSVFCNELVMEADDRQGNAQHQATDFRDLQSDGYQLDQIQDMDVSKILGYFAAKKETDPAFYFEYSHDKNLPRNLFWSDSTCRLDYACFGDVISLDIAEKKFVDSHLLVMVVGINHHQQNIIFGCAVLEDKSTESYMWMLNTFLCCMGNKQPSSAITNEDKALHSALKIVFPDIHHRLCVSDLERNAKREIKIPEFLCGFRKCLLDGMDVEDFEKHWLKLVEQHNLQNNSWVTKLYNDRHIWAEAYLKGCFFGGLRTTFRCEGMSSVVNLFTDNQLKLFELVQYYEKALERIRREELEADHSSTYSKHICTHVLRSYESQAADLFTATSFRIFQEELNTEAAYFLSGNVVSDGECRTYHLCQWQQPSHITKVVLNTASMTIRCSCMMLESRGFPCRHAINVCKLAHLSHLPESFILKRWTKAAKASFDELPNAPEFSSELVEMIRFGSLFAKCRYMCYLASKRKDTYEDLLEEIQQLTAHFAKLTRAKPSNSFRVDSLGGGNPFVSEKSVMQPKSINRSSTIQSCGRCRKFKFRKSSCPHITSVDATIVDATIVESNDGSDQDIMDLSYGKLPMPTCPAATQDSFLCTNFRSPSSDDQIGTSSYESHPS